MARSLEPILNSIRILYKTFLFFILIILFLLSTFLASLFCVDPRTKLKYSTKLTSFFARLSLIVIGVRVKVRGKDKTNFKTDKGLLIVSNHLSYLDIFVISSTIPSVFIAGVDSVQEKFLLGTVTRLSGGIFVVRKNRKRVEQDLGEILKVLDLGFYVVLFPEGTTSNGDSVSPFKSSFFASATASETDILPVCMKYKKINDLEIDEKNRDLVFYYGEETEFFWHFFKLLTLRSIDADINFISPVKTIKGKTRKELCSITYNKILNVYKNQQNRQSLVV